MVGATRCGRRTDRDRKQGDQADRGRIMTDSHPTSTTIVVSASQPMVAVLGPRDELLRVVETAFPSTDISVRGNEITVAGEPGEVALVERLFDELITVLRTGQGVTSDAVERMVSMLRTETGERPAEVLTLNILSNRGRTIRPKTLNQKRYVDAIDRNTITFGIGPAGTGKTYLAVAKGVQALQAKQVTRIILTRPAVEAGERLGFLPGTLFEKIDPYLRPLYDALHDMIDPESIPRLMTAGTIEVAPLAYMRGRSQPIDTPVLTPDGFRPIGELTVGDWVYGSDGFPTPVLGVYPQGRREVYRVTTQDGASTLACAEHLWFVTTRHDKRNGRAGRVVETQDMIGKLRHAHYLELPMVRPVEFPEVDPPLDPYALGLLLGDGCMSVSPPSFSTGDPELALALQSAVPGIEVRHRVRTQYTLKHLATVGGRTDSHPVTAAVRALELFGHKAGTKFIPPEYMLNTSAARLALLQGLLDTDGGPVTQQGRTCRIQYTTCSPDLRDNVVWLVQSLGGVAYVRTRPAEGRKPGLANGRPVHHRLDAYILDIRLPAGLEPFRLARKKALYDAAGGGRPMRFIDSIEPAGEAECVCIAVGAEDSLYVTTDFLVTHNSLNDAFIILDEAQNTSPEQMKMFLTRLGFGSKMVVTGDVTQVDLPGGTSSGLRVVQEILDRTQDVEFCRLTSQDVVRHRLVSDIVEAYGRWDADQEEQSGRGSGPRSGSGGSGRRRR
jgi:phosphate starvation-inducible PhoH-like protein